MTTININDDQYAALQVVSADMLGTQGNRSTQQPVSADIIKTADEVVEQLFAVDVDNDAAKQQAVQSVETMGLKLQQEASRRSEILKQPIATLARNSEDGGPVAKSLLDLRDTVEDLDPNQYDFSTSGMRRLLALIPGVGSALRRYFSKFQSASGVIDNIVDALDKGAEQLKRDNITLTDDQQFLQQLTKKLEQAVVLGQQIDMRLGAKLDQLLKDDPRYAFIEQELLFPLRQRIIDLQQQQAVAQQAVLTVEVIVRNNKELVRGVQRALNVTVTALQTAVTLALALENQRITLAKVTAVNETTNKLIAGTASKLRTQGVDIHKQAAATQLDIAVLRTAFADIAAALDDIQQFRRAALPQMQQNITEMEHANQANAQRIESLLKGRDSQDKLGLGNQIDQLFDLDNKFDNKE